MNAAKCLSELAAGVRQAPAAHDSRRIVKERRGRQGRLVIAVAGESRLQHGVADGLHLLPQAGEILQHLGQLLLALGGLRLAPLGPLAQLLLLAR
jgi:hypothetical protein